MNIFQNLRYALCKMWNVGFCTTFLVLSGLSFNQPLIGTFYFPPTPSDSSLPLALELETNFWNAVVSGNEALFSDDISFAFQGMNEQGGVYTRSDFIAALKSSGLTGYTFYRATSLQFQDVLVFSYIFSGSGDTQFDSTSISVWRFDPIVDPTDEESDQSSNSSSDRKKKKNKKNKEEKKVINGKWRMINHTSGTNFV